jgi:hypothetical protein
MQPTCRIKRCRLTTADDSHHLTDVAQPVAGLHTVVAVLPLYAEGHHRFGAQPNA